MDPFLGFLIVYFALKMLADDAYSMVKGTPNRRLTRRRVRQQHRSQNRIWSAFVNYLGDLAEDAARDATEARRRRKERKRQQHQEVVVTQPDPADDPKEDAGPEATSPAPGPAYPSNVVPLFPAIQAPTKENTMSTSTAVNGEVLGLSQAIEYAEALATFAGEHASAGNEGYIGVLVDASVEGEALASAHDMQEAFAAAQAAAELHHQHLVAQRPVQEAHQANPDAGDKKFMLNGN